MSEKSVHERILRVVQPSKTDNNQLLPSMTMPLSDPILEGELRDKREKLLEEQQRRALAERDADRAIQLAKNASSRVQDMLAENHKLKTELADKTLELAKSQSEKNQRVRNPKIDNETDASNLDQMRLEGTTHAILVRGHARRVLALRIGIEMRKNQDRLNMKIIKRVDSTKYQVDFPSNSKSGYVVLGIDKAIFARTFHNTNDEKWFDAVKKETGKPDKYYKDNMGMTLSELVAICDKVERSF